MPLRRVNRSAIDARHTDLQLWSISQGASTWIVDLGGYEACRIAGIPVHWTIDPVEGYIEARVFDGTGDLVARWPTTRRPSPLQRASQGRGLVLEGVTSVATNGELILIEPAFHRAEFPSVA